MGHIYTHAHTYAPTKHRGLSLTVLTAATTSEIQQVQKSTPSKKNGVNYFTDELYPHRMEITAFTKQNKTK